MVKVEDASGNVVSAAAAREDVVLSSVEAMIEAINKVLYRKRIQKAALTAK